MTRRASIVGRWKGRLREERGVTLVEVLVAALVLVTGLLGAFGTISSSAKATVAAERVAAMTAVAQQTLATVQALPYTAIADSSAPVKTSTTDPTDPTYYLSTCSGGTCYQWDQSNTANTETVLVDTTNGKVAPGPVNTVVAAPNTSGCTSTTTSNCRITLGVYVFVTEVVDSVCAQSGVTCAGTYSYKRISVAINNEGPGAPNNPVYLSGFAIAKAGGTSNPLTVSGTQCLDGTNTVACTH